MVSNNRLLRKCGKKLPRYCDINNDRRISMTEWLSCLNAQHSVTGELLYQRYFILTNDNFLLLFFIVSIIYLLAENPEKSSTSKPKRMGPNPLDQFLNDDD